MTQTQAEFLEYRNPLETLRSCVNEGDRT